MEKNWCYTITEKGHPHYGETLWSGRYCAVAAFIFLVKGEDCYILANQRGEGTPDFQGMWNCPCGFLECDESAEEGCSREVLEETNFYVNPRNFNLVTVETDPEVCNKGHVTLRYMAIVNEEDLDPNYNIEEPQNIKNLKGGEVDEVSAIKWINIEDLDKYDWAFNHKEVVRDLLDYIAVVQHNL